MTHWDPLGHTALLRQVSLKTVERRRPDPRGSPWGSIDFRAIPFTPGTRNKYHVTLKPLNRHAWIPVPGIKSYVGLSFVPGIQHKLKKQVELAFEALWSGGLWYQALFTAPPLVTIVYCFCGRYVVAWQSNILIARLKCFNNPSSLSTNLWA